jgi:hypothetical protein
VADRQVINGMVYKIRFFRLSRHADRLRDLITGGALRIEPAARRNEVLSLIESGLHVFSVSRSHSSARGWGIPAPDDPSRSSTCGGTRWATTSPASATAPTTPCTWQGEQLGDDEYVISADEKTSIPGPVPLPPRLRPRQGQAMRVNHTYRRGAPWPT